MKVRVTVTLDVDPDAWVDVYGIERSAVRQDVQDWAYYLLHAAADNNGVTA